jgi:MYXO-CTERM domain-containing protein
MKKTMVFFLFIICMTFVFSVSAFAESSSTLLTEGVATMGSHVTNSANTYGTNNTGTNANNYRTYATTGNNNSNWGWLGLLGLAGLAGLRSRDRERT